MLSLLFFGGLVKLSGDKNRFVRKIVHLNTAPEWQNFLRKHARAAQVVRCKGFLLFERKLTKQNRLKKTNLKEFFRSLANARALSQAVIV